MAGERTVGLAYTHSKAGLALQAHALEIGPTDAGSKAPEGSRPDPVAKA